MDRKKFQIQIPLPPKIDPSVSLMQIQEKPDVTYKDVGGCTQQIEQMREVVELPMLHVRILPVVRSDYWPQLTHCLLSLLPACSLSASSGWALTRPRVCCSMVPPVPERRCWRGLSPTGTRICWPF